MRYLVLLLTIVVASCSQPQKPVRFKADISNTEAKEIIISGFDYTKNIAIAEAKASDTLNITQAGVYQLSFGRAKTGIYLEPGDEVTMSADAKDFTKSLTITSPHTDVQDYIKVKADLEGSIFSRSLFDLSPEEFATKVSSRKDSLASIFNASPAKEILSYESESVDLFAKRLMFIYPDYSDQKIADLPVEYQDVLAGIDLGNESKYTSMPNYKSLVKDHFSMNMYRDTSDTYEEVFMKHIAKLPAGNIRNQLLYGDMRYIIGPNDKLEKMYSFFNEKSSNTEHKEKIEELYTAFQKLKKGELSPTFDYENHSGGTTKTEDLAGKYVYVDVWATWCGPCIGEIPSLKKIEKQYHGKNIEFVSISIDNKPDHDKWKKMVDDKELGGVQLMADSAWQSKFVQDYKINGIPRFILIDPEGKIVSADAPRPSDKKLIETLEGLSI
ncbi:MAG: thiol-disulfide isomerase/thioredoxin [Halioglobus sp.]|jgi:thiol-disulfide isomerase/thioredoxin